MSEIEPDSFGPSPYGMGGIEPLRAADVDRVAKRIEAVKASAYLVVTPELLEGVRDFQEAMDALLAQAMDPNYVPPPPWEGEPITPRPTGYLRLAEAVRQAPLLADLLELHRPEPSFVRHDGTIGWWQCRGCDAEGYEWEYPTWPCRTSGLIAERLGVDLEAE